MLTGGGWASNYIELTFDDLNVIKCNDDSVEYCAAAILDKLLTSGKATKQTPLEALQAVK